MSRATSVRTARLEAACLRCAWRATTLNAHGLAARHHDATAHPVTVHVDRVITYGDPAAPPPDQAVLFSRDPERTP